ncbi:MAG: tandem-95 repeat protein, partial [Arcobacter sp.]|nr:tandem-95 repeat protein [Arcobacter sp.]
MMQSSANIIKDIIVNKSDLNTEFLRSLKIFQMVASINDFNDSNHSAVGFKAIAQAIVNDENIKHDGNISVTVYNTQKLITHFISAPVFMDIPTPTVQSGTTFVMNLNFVESPDGGTLSYSLSGTDSGLFEIRDNKIYFKTAPFFVGNVGNSNSKEFILVASVNGKSVEKNIIVTVVMATPIAPVAIFASFNTDEDTNFTGTLTATDADTNLSSLSYSKVSNPSRGTVTVNSNGTFTYTPTANYNGTDSFSYKVSDGENNVTQTVNITVNPVNDAPVATFSSLSTNEDTNFTGTLTATDIDTNSSNLVYNLVINASHGTVTVNSNGTFTYVPIANYYGADSFSYKVNDGSSNSATQEVNITVTSIDDAPIAISSLFSTNEDINYTGTLPVATDIDT